MIDLDHLSQSIRALTFQICLLVVQDVARLSLNIAYQLN